jgi:hypothetical protein
MPRNQFNQQLVFVMQTIMGLAYLGGGLFLVASSLTYGILPTGTIRYAIGGLLIVYGLFRVYRGIQLWKNES